MWCEIPNTSRQQFGFVQDNVMDNYENNGNFRKATNVSLETGEEFSEIFLRERVSPQRTAIKNDIYQKQQEQQQKTMDYNFIQNNHLGINRRDNNGGLKFPGFSPGRYAFDIENEYYFKIASSVNKEITSPQQRERFFDGSNVDRTASEQAVPNVFSLECSDSKQASSCVSQVTYGSFSRMKLLCSFGGRIFLRPSDGKLKYLGGETRIISIRKNLAYNELVWKTTGICNQPHKIKYQLPGEDLDALISVSSDEDLHLMIKEYCDLEGSSQRMRIFLLPLNDSETQSYLEARTQIQTEANYQYVATVNSILDSCPPRISSRENLISLASQANMLGSTMDYSPWFQRETSTFFHPLHIQNGGNPFKRRLESPRAQFLNTQAPFEPCYASHFKDSRSFQKKMYGDNMHVDGQEYNNLNSKDQLVFENLYYLDVSSCYHNQPLERFRIENHDHMNNHFTEFNNGYRPPSHVRKISKEFLNSPSNVQFEADKKSLIANDKELHFEDLISSQDKRGLFLRKEAAAKCQERVTPALSDAQFQGEEGFNLMLEEETNPFQMSQKFGLEKSPCFSGMSQQCLFEHSGDSHKKYLHLKNEQQHLQKRQFTQWSEDIEIKRPSFDQDGARHRVGDSNMSHSVFFQHHHNLPKINPNSLFSAVEQNVFKENISLLPYPFLENAIDNGIGQPRNHRLRPEILESLSLSDNVPFSQPDIRTSLVKKINLRKMHDPYQRREQNPYNIIKKRTSDILYCEQSTLRDETSTLYQPVVKHIEVIVPESTVIVEDMTCPISHHILSPSSMVPLVQPSDQILSLGRETEVETTPIENENEDVKVDGDDMEDFVDEAAIIELEAGPYGLQIINNTDLEDLQVLGSGTFGTVYHGMWRGTDVAIKRNKKSCFAGKSSEQERLTKDFWREAQILSKLHHPNILAFYGVVPDGPDGTLAIVTEFMIDGSLRHALLRKDRKTLDRRRKVMIALDAAFGMEYLHMKNIVHFDLKCDNLLVNLRDPQRPVCKVGDFGLSRIKCNTLISGGVQGTLPWMAPELLDGSSSQVSEKVDVFSFGITMWEILTAEEPYANLHCGAIIGGIVNNTLRPPIPERCDPKWRKLMEECWSHEPATRPSFTDITYRLRCMLMALQPKRYNRTRR